MKTKKLHALLWLLLIPWQIILGTIFVFTGFMTDLRLFSSTGEGRHGFPVFSVIFMLIALAVTLVVVIVALVPAIRGFRRQ